MKSKKVKTCGSGGIVVNSAGTSLCITVRVRAPQTGTVTNNPPTGSDFVSNGSNGYKLGLVVTHNGKVFTYKAGKIPFTADGFGITVNKYRRLDYNEFDAIIQTLSDYTQQYGIEWSER